jgi:hypothetical protein
MSFLLCDNLLATTPKFQLADRANLPKKIRKYQILTPITATGKIAKRKYGLTRTITDVVMKSASKPGTLRML